MRLRSRIVLFLLMLALSDFIRAQVVFSSVKDVYAFIDHQSAVAKKQNIKSIEAKRGRLLAIYSAIDPRVSGTLNMTNNTTLPVSLFPAEAFGGEEGTYQEVETGIKYTNTFGQSLELDVIDVSAWRDLKLARLNQEMVALKGELDMLSYKEEASKVYFDILKYRAQMETSQKSKWIADSLLSVLKYRLEKGLVRSQDFQLTKINAIKAQSNVEKLEFILQHEIMALKILCDMDAEIDLIINEDIATETISFQPLPVKANEVSIRYTTLNEMYKKEQLRQVGLENLPRLSAFASNSWQQFSTNFSLFDKEVGWINSNYIGLKITYQIPTSSYFVSHSRSKTDYLIAQEELKHTMLEKKQLAEQLQTNYKREWANWSSNLEVMNLRKDIYEKTIKNYESGLIGVEELLDVLNELISSEYDQISAKVDVLIAWNKIELNNNEL